jgi:hypothetical protein
MHTHSGGAEGHETHGGSRGLGWELLDSIMLACFVVLAAILGEQLYRSWRAHRVRYDLTPEGRAAAVGDVHPHSGVRIDTSYLGPTGDGDADLAAAVVSDPSAVPGPSHSPGSKAADSAGAARSSDAGDPS